MGAPTIGGLIGGLLSGFIADAVGRKRVLIGLGCLYLVSAFMSALANGYEMLVVARAIGGLAFASLISQEAPRVLCVIQPGSLVSTIPNYVLCMRGLLPETAIRRWIDQRELCHQDTALALKPRG